MRRSRMRRGVLSSRARGGFVARIHVESFAIDDDVRPGQHDLQSRVVCSFERPLRLRVRTQVHVRRQVVVGPHVLSRQASTFTPRASNRPSPSGAAAGIAQRPHEQLRPHPVQGGGLLPVVGVGRPGVGVERIGVERLDTVTRNRSP